MNYDLTELERRPDILNNLIERYFHCRPVSQAKISEGFYGAVYAAVLPADPGRLAIKCFKHSARHRSEHRQLELLRPRALLKLPEVYFVHDHTPDLPCEALLMEYVDGINASALPTGHPHRERFAEALIDNLLHWHETTNDFFGFGADRFPDWVSCLQSRLDNHYRILRHDFSGRVAPSVLAAAEKSLENLRRIFAEPVVPSLIHSDYNLWNLLVDPASAAITAVLDPSDAGWADREMDLFQLQNADGDRFSLLERYQNRTVLSELFPVRKIFYWFWDDIRHLENMGWYDEERFTSSARRLLRLMNQYL